MGGGVLQVQQCCCCYCSVLELSGSPPPSGSFQMAQAPSSGFLDSGTAAEACCGGLVHLPRLAGTGLQPHGVPPGGELGQTLQAGDSEPEAGPE